MDSKKETTKKTTKKVENTNEGHNESNEIKYFDIEGKFMLVNIGNQEKPASPEQIEVIQKQLDDLFAEHNINCLALVTHHAVDVRLIERTTCNIE